jgi:hypothetical protein
MGYRSDVAIALNTTADVNLRLESRSEAISVLDNADQIIKGDDHTTYFLEGVKWYDGYPEVDEIMDYLGTLNHDDFGYMRIGESDDDFEAKGDPYAFGIECHRHISI